MRKKRGYKTGVHNFKAHGILGTKLKDNTYGLYLLLPSSKDLAIPTLLPIHDYTSIGTGARYANFMFKTQFRVLSTVAQKPISIITNGLSNMDYNIYYK